MGFISIISARILQAQSGRGQVVILIIRMKVSIITSVRWNYKQRVWPAGICGETEK